MKNLRASLVLVCLWRFARVHGQATPATSTSSLTNDWKTAFPNPNGGWALRSGRDAQGPLNATACKNNEWDCPNSLHCVSLVVQGDTEYGPYACCPDASNNCTQQLLEKPTCADPIWGLYRLTDFPLNGSLYCCYPFQRGTSSGFCELPGDQQVTYAESISQISYTGVRPTPTPTPTSSSGSRSTVITIGYHSYTIPNFSTDFDLPGFVGPTTSSRSSSGGSTSSSGQQLSTVSLLRIVFSICSCLIALTLIALAIRRRSQRRTNNSELPPPVSQTPIATTTTNTALPGGHQSRSTTKSLPPPPYSVNDPEAVVPPGAPATSSINTSPNITTTAR